MHSSTPLPVNQEINLQLLSYLPKNNNSVLYVFCVSYAVLILSVELQLQYIGTYMLVGISNFKCNLLLLLGNKLDPKI
jgi:hypothetical protein